MSKYQPYQLPINVGLPPTGPQGARSIGPIYITFDPTATGTNMQFSDDLIIENEDGSINNIQSMYFDNSTSINPIYLTMLDTGQNLTLPAKTQGYLPLLTCQSGRYIVNYTGIEAAEQGNQGCTLYFLNVPIQPFIWSGAPSPPSTPTFATSSGFVVGNTAFNVQAGGGPAVGAFINRTIMINGFDIQGGGATTESVVDVQLQGVQSTIGGAIATAHFAVDVPAIGQGNLNFARTFNPPLRGTPNGPIGSNPPVLGQPPGYLAGTIFLIIPAMGAGQVNVSANLYYSYI